MFDGSHYRSPGSKKAPKGSQSLRGEEGYSLEAEVGSIGGEEDGVIGSMGGCAGSNECKAIADLRLICTA